jgi:hypothetical protein
MNFIDVSFRMTAGVGAIKSWSPLALTRLLEIRHRRETESVSASSRRVIPQPVDLLDLIGGGQGRLQRHAAAGVAASCTVVL